MEITNIHNAKTNLSKLLELVTKGEQVIIAKSGKPVAILSPFAHKHSKRAPGALKGALKILPGFDALPKSLLKHFGA